MLVNNDTPAKGLAKPGGICATIVPGSVRQTKIIVPFTNAPIRSPMNNGVHNLLSVGIHNPRIRHDGKAKLMAMMEERHTTAQTASQTDTKRFFVTRQHNFGDASLLGDAPLETPMAHHRLPARVISIAERSVRLPPCSGGRDTALYQISKRAGDITCASLAILFLAFPLVVVALLVWLEDRGPAFYYQTRVGKDGKPFRFYKFRSMVTNADAIKAELANKNEADGPIFKMKNDPRITRVGRFLRRSSVDELPQLINVLRGEMSLIGPRPQLPREVDLYTEAQRNRLLVQPGLLCLREVFGRSTVSFEQWIELDLLYIERRSLQTDLWILRQIIPAVVRAEGAY